VLFHRKGAKYKKMIYSPQRHRAHRGYFLFCLFDPGDSEYEGGFSREQQLMVKLKKTPCAKQY